MPTAEQQQTKKDFKPRFKVDPAASPMPETRQPERLAPRATSNRNGGRDHLGILGEIKSEYPGEIIGIGRLIQEKLVGRATIEWAKLEGCMNDAAHRLLGVPFEYGRVVTSRMDATGLIKLLRDLGHLRLPEAEFHKLSVICDKIDIRREDRNLIVHGSWGRVGNSDPYSMSLKVKTDDPSHVVSETFSHTRMRNIIDDILSLKWELVGLLKLSEMPVPLHGQPPAE